MTTDEPYPADEPPPLLVELKRGGEMIFDNAQQLNREARLLRENGAFARSVCLHQLSNEECGKIDIVGAWAMSLVLGHEVDPNRTSRALRDHKAKNYTNAYFSGLTDEERSARERRDWRAALKLFRSRQAEIHDAFNTQKNAALYVNFENGTFSAPKEAITEAQADEMALVNDYFLWIAENHVRLLKSLESNDRGLRTSARRLVTRLQELKTQQPEDPESVLRIAIQEMFDEALGDIATRNHERKA